MPDKKGSDKPSRKKAIALRYDQQKDTAPTVIGKGSGFLAEKLIALAEEHGIPIHQDADLTEVLARLDLYQEIPPHTYLVVAEILAFLHRTNSKYSR